MSEITEIGTVIVPVADQDRAPGPRRSLVTKWTRCDH